MKTLLLFVASAAGLALRPLGTPAPELLLNQIQVIGSHNSYKQAIDPRLFKKLQKADSVSMSKIDYEHQTLSQQLDRGLRALEIDVYADTQGGKYAHPKGLDLRPLGPPAPELLLNQIQVIGSHTATNKPSTLGCSKRCKRPIR